MRKSRSKSSRIFGRRGAAAVEFAVVAPFLFLLVIGMIEIGRAMMVQHVLTLSAREGARVAVLMTATTDTVQARVNDFAEAANPNLGELNTVVTPDPATAVSGDFMSVTVSLPISAMSAWGQVWFGDAINLSSVAVMRKEGFE